MKINDKIVLNALETEDWPNLGRFMFEALGEGADFVYWALGWLFELRDAGYKWDFYGNFEVLAESRVKWAAASDLFSDIRGYALADNSNPIHSYGECLCKVISNNSYKPGMYDVNSGWSLVNLFVLCCDHSGLDQLRNSYVSGIKAHCQHWQQSSLMRKKRIL